MNIIPFLFFLIVSLFSCRSDPGSSLGQRPPDSSTDSQNHSGSDSQQLTSEKYRAFVLKALSKMDNINILLGARNGQIEHDFKGVDLCLDDSDRDDINGGAKDTVEDPGYRPLMLSDFDFNNMEEIKRLDFLKGKVNRIVFDWSTSKFWHGSVEAWAPLLKKGGAFYIPDPQGYSFFPLFSYSDGLVKKITPSDFVNLFHMKGSEEFSFFNSPLPNGRVIPDLEKKCSLKGFQCELVSSSVEKFSPFKKKLYFPSHYKILMKSEEGENIKEEVLKYKEGEVVRVNSILTDSYYLDEKGDLASFLEFHPYFYEFSFVDKNLVLKKGVQEGKIPADFKDDDGSFSPQFSFEEGKGPYPLNRTDDKKVTIKYYLLKRLR